MMMIKKTLTKTAASFLTAAVLMSGSTIPAGISNALVVSVFASETMTTTASVRMRSGASSNADLICILPKGVNVTVTDNSNGSWYKVSYEGQEGYVYAKYLSAVSLNGTTKIVAEAMNIRSSMDKTKSSNIVAVVPTGGEVQIVSTEADDWYIVTYKGTTGYMRGGHFTDDTSRMTTAKIKTVAEKLFLRSSMDRSGNKNVILTIPKNGEVTILSEEANLWYQVSYNGTTGYIRGGHFTDDTSRLGIGSLDPEVRIINTDLYMRSSMSKKNSSNILLTIPEGGKVTLRTKEADNWFKVTYEGTTGYIKGGHFD